MGGKINLGPVQRRHVLGCSNENSRSLEDGDRIRSTRVVDYRGCQVDAGAHAVHISVQNIKAVHTQLQKRSVLLVKLSVFKTKYFLFSPCRKFPSARPCWEDCFRPSMHSKRRPKIQSAPSAFRLVSNLNNLE